MMTKRRLVGAFFLESIAGFAIWRKAIIHIALNLSVQNALLLLRISRFIV